MQFKTTIVAASLLLTGGAFFWGYTTDSEQESGELPTYQPRTAEASDAEPFGAADIRKMMLADLETYPRTTGATASGMVLNRAPASHSPSETGASPEPPATDFTPAPVLQVHSKPNDQAFPRAKMAELLRDGFALV